MPIRLEFVGRDITRRDPMKFLAELRAKYPTLTERGLHEVAGREFARKKPRNPAMVVHLFGEDITADDLETIAAWPIIDPKEKRVLLRLSPAERAGKVDPQGLGQTYVWRESNGWTQEVTDADAAVLRRSTARTWFRDIDAHGPFVVARAWDFPVAERQAVPNLHEAQKFLADVTRKPQWTGR
jgi:hypothetical protein